MRAPETTEPESERGVGPEERPQWDPDDQPRRPPQEPRCWAVMDVRGDPERGRGRECGDNRSGDAVDASDRLSAKRFLPSCYALRPPKVSTIATLSAT
jgi:hypothetical protein